MREPKANSSMGGSMNKLAGAMAPASGKGTRGAERQLAKEPSGGHPTADSGKVRMGGSVGNNAGLGDAVKHLHGHAAPGVHTVGKYKIS